MKKVNHILFAVALLASATAASAATAASDLSIQGDVHAASAYNFRGMAMSAGEPSIGLKVAAIHASGLYGSYGVDTIKLGDPRSGDLGVDKDQLHNVFTVGYNRSLANGLILGGGLTRHAFSGKAHVSDLSFSEMFVNASWNGLTGKLAAVVEGADARYPGFSRGDVYGELGYTHKIGNYSLGGDVGYGWYDGKHAGAKDGLAMAQLRASYNFTPNLEVQLTHQLSWGDDAWGHAATGNNKTFVKASYRF
ncbi:hypothetical protein ACOTC5_30165 [Achromobacter xylosoxidans]